MPCFFAPLNITLTGRLYKKMG